MEMPSYEVIKFKLLGTRFTFAVIDINVTSSPKYILDSSLLIMFSWEYLQIAN